MASAAAKSINPFLALGLLTAATLAALLLLPPIPQDQAYHLFADRRTLFGVPNFWNVVSNIPYLVAGGWGLARFRDTPAMIVLSLGFLLTGIGSSYYHWDPRDGTLFWDRLPMTLSFAAVFALVVDERVGSKTGAAVLWPMLAIGVSSLLVWLWIDDLRLYFWAQFFPVLALLVLMMLYPARYSHPRYWLFAAALYALAKVFEFADGAVYSLGHIVSGHTLKHLLAAAACFAVLRYLEILRPVA
jgi:hypothetical protein